MFPHPQLSHLQFDLTRDLLQRGRFLDKQNSRKRAVVDDNGEALEELKTTVRKKQLVAGRLKRKVPRPVVDVVNLVASSCIVLQ